MSRTCTICNHPQRAQLEAAIAANVSNRRIATQFSTSEAAIRRHTSEHIAETIKQTQVAKVEAQSIDVVKQLKTINAVTIAILNEARAGKMHALALSAIDRVQKQIELQAKLLGAIDKPQEQEAPDGVVIPSDVFKNLPPQDRMEIRRALLEAEQRKERAS
jgi:hypothetical protein